MEHVLYADIERCVGCHSCEIACRQEHDIPNDDWCIRVMTVEPRREENLRDFYFFSIASNKCGGCRDLLQQAAEPACVSACPTRCIRYAEVNALPQVIDQRKRFIILRTYS